MRVSWLLWLAALVIPLGAAAVPEANHVRLECNVLRLAVNNYTVRHQLRLRVIVSAPAEAELSEVELALMSVTNPAGESVTIGPHSCTMSPRRFKAAHATLLFKAVEDSAAPFPAEPSNVPAGFFAEPGPYDVSLTVRGEQFSGRVSFGAPLSLQVRQAGKAISNFSLAAELPFLVETQPRQFGPVYYKRQDLTNFVFQLANMEQSLESQDYHPAVESPQYLFQLRVGDPEGGPTRLVDPARYIEGYTSHMIRSELTSTPLTFAADEFKAGDVVVVDFSRTDTLPPDSVFTSERQRFSSQTVVQDRVVYALYAEQAPTDAELGRLAAEQAEAGGDRRAQD